jgi:outer membrane receptor protein involved in Fe transport
MFVASVLDVDVAVMNIRLASCRTPLQRHGLVVLVCALSSALQVALAPAEASTGHTAKCDAAGPCKPGGTRAAPKSARAAIEEIEVVARRRKLIGSATTASQGMVTGEEVRLTPTYRPGQVLETVPGLIVTLHSGEGKANQYLMRGYNLDHGTDLETYVDDMPINQPSHAHGQGYTDLNFLLPELVDGLTYTKGPYYGYVGDFGAVGSVRVNLRDDIPDQVSLGVGTLGWERLFAAGSTPAGKGEVLGALELQHYDGPFVVPDDARRENGVLRYSQGGDDENFSLTGMVYHQVWTNTTDIPVRAIDEGLVPNRFGSLDPSDGGHALRGSLSGIYTTDLGDGSLSASVFAIFNELHLFNDFTHYLVDPVHGDQEDQFETREVAGGAADYTLPVSLGTFPTELRFGVQARNDVLHVGRLPSEGQQPLPAKETVDDPPSFSDDDDIYLLALAAYAQATTHWTPWLRTVLALRDDFQYGADHDNLAALHETAGYTNGGTKSQSLPQPKGSVIYTATPGLEFYLSAGEGFHSADLRGVNQDRSVDLGLPGTPLLARQYGEEVGLRGAAAQDVTFTVALYNLWQQSETIIDPDVGQDVAGPPSDRYGVEVNLTWQLRKWLELYVSYSANHARFTHPFDDGTGHLGEFITDAPKAAGSAALYVQTLGDWSGGLTFRYLGDYPLSSGPCVNSAAVHDFPGVATSCNNAPTLPGQVNGKGYGQLNLEVTYKVLRGWSATLGIYNLLNEHAAAAEFWYVDRLQNEITRYPDGVADVHEHPLEPLMVRFSITRSF